MSRTERQETIDSLSEQLKGSPNVYVTDFSGLNVLRMTELRRRLRGAGVQYVVVKNTLAQRAFQANGVTGLDDHLAGPTGLVLSGSDPVAGAKVLSDFAREFEKPAIKIGLVDGRTVTADQVKRLASLPTRDVLLGQLAGYMQSPVAQLAGLMNEMLYQVVGALEALRSQRSAAS
ncbi:MAG: 50S ribosomal protein L10 [Gemmatimonadales bacterium]|nr:50S ribosomal protein L10 [Gemmatimonadales bacterium]